jgi:hypothetical protein
VAWLHGARWPDDRCEHRTTPKQSIKKEKETVDAKATPGDWSPAKRRQKVVEARWTKKHGKS